MTPLRTLRPVCGLLSAAGLVTFCLPGQAQTAPADPAVQEVVVTANKRSTLASKTTTPRCACCTTLTTRP